jgi:hypothetical protein
MAICTCGRKVYHPSRRYFIIAATSNEPNGMRAVPLNNGVTPHRYLVIVVPLWLIICRDRSPQALFHDVRKVAA